MPQLQEFSELKELDEGEWRIWIAGKLVSIDKRLDEQNGKVKCIPNIQGTLIQHKVFFGILGFVVASVLVPLAIYFIKYHLGI